MSNIKQIIKPVTQSYKQRVYQRIGRALRKHVEKRVLIEGYMTADNDEHKDILGQALEFYPYN